MEILNPINPHENFADRWTGPNCPLRLNFYQWIDSALTAFDAWRSVSAPQRLIEVAKDDFEVSLGADAARALTGGAALAPTARRVAIDAPPAPWRG